jgi:3-deoxy-D-manno-octulosonate 8-phosphate phosphatase (KDO 8-P phosphatase)
MRNQSKFVPRNLILDTDGVFTDGKMYYSSEGKILKAFGADDSDALNLAKNRLNITVVSADSRGFSITKRRIESDMGFDLHLVSARARPRWINENFDSRYCIYMGDGLLDPLVFRMVGYSIAPANASLSTRKEANHVTKNKGGEGAVAEAVIHIFDRFFGGFNIDHDQTGE